MKFPLKVLFNLVIVIIAFKAGIEFEKVSAVKEIGKQPIFDKEFKLEENETLKSIEENIPVSDEAINVDNNVENTSMEENISNEVNQENYQENVQINEESQIENDVDFIEETQIEEETGFNQDEDEGLLEPSILEEQN